MLDRIRGEEVFCFSELGRGQNLQGRADQRSNPPGWGEKTVNQWASVSVSVFFHTGCPKKNFKIEIFWGSATLGTFWPLWALLDALDTFLTFLGTFGHFWVLWALLGTSQYSGHFLVDCPTQLTLYDLDLSVVFHDKYQWEIWKNTAGKSARHFWALWALHS